MGTLNDLKIKVKMKKSANAVSSIAPSKRLEKITKVTFETDDGQTFVLNEARVWKIKFVGNLAYQIRGEVPDLEAYFK